MNLLLRRMLCVGLVLLMLVSLCACEGLGGESGTADTAVYNGLFDSSRVHTVEVSLSEEDWADLRENPLDKTKYEATVVIDGESLKQVSFATKGNTSLSSVASSPDSDRYSFKLNFGKFVKHQSYHGLDKLSLNNLYADATFMKDFLSYGLFRRIGVEGSLVSYVWLTVNGADQGLYIAVEDVSEAWMDRTQQGEGVVYKPEAEQLNQAGGAPGGEGQMPTPPGGDGNMPTPPEGGEPGSFPGGPGGELPGGPGGSGEFPGGPGEMGGPGGMGFGENAKGADLRYTDDEPASYSDIFDNAETKTDLTAEGRVIAALKALSQGRPEEALDTEEVIRYFAAHNFTLNYDSYTGTMLHNYYLFERDGKLSMFPLDYNLAYGAFAGSAPGDSADATSLINTGIDSPLSGTGLENRPMWAWITEDASWLEEYHAACDRLLKDYFESGAFEAEIDELYELLRPYVEKDPTAFYTVEEFDRGVATLKQVCLLRAASIRAQLDGSLATVTQDQDPAARIDASGVTVSDMGTHMGGGPKGFER